MDYGLVRPQCTSSFFLTICIHLRSFIAFYQIHIIIQAMFTYLHQDEVPCFLMSGYCCLISLRPLIHQPHCPWPYSTLVFKILKAMNPHSIPLCSWNAARPIKLDLLCDIRCYSLVCVSIREHNNWKQIMAILCAVFRPLLFPTIYVNKNTYVSVFS